ncbi:hypothetical protein SAMN05216359_105321 [Roseateles sp. YR242]|nr:hypothetical protein [Roseateles sp. YR242]SEL13395.1 hypothetical protein SAMN05216359_105321 [Roseateles sp. YR242]
MSGPDHLDPIATEAIGSLTRIGGTFAAALLIVLMLALPAMLT